MLAVMFLAPGWLWLALALPLVWFVPRPLQDRVHGVLRTLVLLGVVAALAHPVSFTAVGEEWRVVVLDAHGSTQAQDAARAGAVAEALGAGGRGAGRSVLVHAAGTSVPASLVRRFDHVVTRQAGRSSSPLGALLASAGRAIPAGARGSITLLSDGLATDRRWGPAVQDLQARGLPVHVVPLRAEGRPVTLVGVQVPDVVRVGHTARLAVDLAGSRDVATVVLVDARGAELARATARAPVVLAYEPEQAGVHEVEVRVLGPDGAYAATPYNHRQVRLAVQPPLRVLYVGERMQEGGPKLGNLVGPGFELVAPHAQPENQLYASDLVVIDDATADRVPERMQRTILALVDAGRLGLVMAGGRAAFGAGGWHRQPLAEALPIEMIQKEEKRDPSTTLVVIIDTSGSMGGNRVQLAKEVSRLAIRRLLPHDKVGIVEFYGAKRWAAPIQPASNAIEIQRALNRLNAGGGTVIMPAIEEAFYGLQNVRTRYKHVLVLTDGGVEQGAFEPLLRRMADKGITVSTVLVGPGMHSEFLVNLANWGKGRFYGVPNRFNLPEIILKQPASAHLPSWRPGRHALATRGASGWWEGVNRGAIPPLSGYVEARARPGADVLLEVAASKHPVLATWRHGLGRVTTLLTEPTGPGTASWADWGDLGTWLARVLARTASEQRRRFRAHATRDRDELVLRIEATRVDEAPQAEFRATPDGAWAAVAVRPRAPGLWSARAPATAAGVFRLVSPMPGAPLRVVPTDDVVPEHQVAATRGLDLARLAAVTGGQAVPLEGAVAFVPLAGGGAAPIGVVPLWPWCLLVALLLYLAEIAWRRRPRGGAQ